MTPIQSLYHYDGYISPEHAKRAVVILEGVLGGNSLNHVDRLLCEVALERFRRMVEVGGGPVERFESQGGDIAAVEPAKRRPGRPRKVVEG